MRLLACLLVLAVHAVPASGWAQEEQASAAAPDHSELQRWVQRTSGVGNRVLVEQIEPKIQDVLLEILKSGVASCDCLPRRIRWVWPLRNHRVPGHFRLVVAFDDRPRDGRKLVAFERFALLNELDGTFSVSSAFNVGRPNVASGGTLRVKLKPRRDLDADDDLDISVSIAELWADQRFCGVLHFQTSLDVLRFEEAECEP